MGGGAKVGMLELVWAGGDCGGGGGYGVLFREGEG